jgi:hypothetical protein
LTSGWSKTDFYAIIFFQCFKIKNFCLKTLQHLEKSTLTLQICTEYVAINIEYDWIGWLLFFDFFPNIGVENAKKGPIFGKKRRPCR